MSDRTPRTSDDFELPDFDFGVESDKELGALVAQLKVHSMKQGFDSEYGRGVDSFFQEHGVSAKDRATGRAIARLVLEERRKTLIEAGKNSLLYGVCAVSIAVAVKMPVQWAIALSIPAVGAGIYTARKF